ncbi:hypothetical protein [Flavobacterium sp.]|uniref:hypothetical protein n=1 Tax=Flavobacterium sp. TaxID=239 RepID=UPI002B4B2D9F|nr:hypothetical protein [Flavobacterium sp.]HLF52777.1 hypothetical protein [Flavobacterium sp.]
MFNQQLDIFQVHRRETKSECEEYLKANKKRLSKNCQALFEAFMRGDRISTFNSPVGDFRRRCCDLKENGIRISFESNGRFKTWYFSDSDRMFNRELLIKLQAQKSLELKK